MFRRKPVKNTKTGVYLANWGVSINMSVFSKMGGELIKILHVLLKNGFRGFRNASIKFLKTMGKHISLNIGEKEEEKDSAFLALRILLNLLRKIVSVKKIQAEALP